MIINNQSELARVAGVNRTTVISWARRKDYPAAAKSAKGIEESAWLAYARIRLEAAKKAQTGDNIDLKKRKLESQCKLLDFDIMRAKRDDEMNKIEHEAKRGLWFHVDQVRDFAQAVASAFDDSVNAVELLTRDSVIVEKVREAFDRTRHKLADEMEK